MTPRDSLPIGAGRTGRGVRPLHRNTDVCLDTLTLFSPTNYHLFSFSRLLSCLPLEGGVHYFRSFLVLSFSQTTPTTAVDMDSTVQHRRAANLHNRIAKVGRGVAQLSSAEGLVKRQRGVFGSSDDDDDDDDDGDIFESIFGGHSA